ncbi:NrdH-redoxin [Candidatus Uhrbacteria bacterium RIFOXYC2_FULL_47_19]|uniref:NrdH-redoxin n=1 Tax=Candidatus Uhrbacteria bacterium RIFOXYC2_FULL_47_19 TaxID=1802424 RepID=A0A1F7WCU9_9BACT|nr:MAG: NrdH-redoxin [Candidatus Uhrbacteria bacterium RIFOXYC2_FULL_47_19]HCC22541.1 NrdH-redoxin [Candidatus Uhrbacteria bacterium]
MEEENQKKVTVYSTPTCPYCVMVKSFLKERGIDYRDINVATDEEAAREMVEKTGQMGVPVIMIGETVIIGFDQEAIIKTLGLE